MRGGGGRVALGFVLQFARWRWRARLLKNLELAEGPVVGAVELAFITHQHGERFALVGAVVEDAGQFGFVVDFGELAGDDGVLEHQFLFVEFGFDGYQPVEAPAGGGQGLDEAGFDGVGGLEAVHVGVAEALEGSAILVGEDDYLGVESVLDGVGGGAGFALWGYGSFGFGSVGAGGVGSWLGWLGFLADSMRARGRLERVGRRQVVLERGDAGGPGL